MTAQRPIAPKEAPDYEFRRQYSLHKVWIALKDGSCKTHYSKDCSATLPQLQWKRVNQGVFSGQESMEDCLRIEKYFRGKYRTLQIYRRGADGKFPQEPIIKYVNGRQSCVTDDSLPADLYCRVVFGKAEAGQPYPFDFVQSVQPATAATDPMPPVKDPPSKRLASEPTKASKFMPGSRAKYFKN